MSTTKARRRGRARMSPHPVIESSAVLDKRTGYSGSIQMGPVEDALEEQRDTIFEVQCLIETCAEALDDGETHEHWTHVRTLQLAAKLLDKAAAGLEAGTLEDRAIAISRAKDAKPANGAAARGRS